MTISGCLERVLAGVVERNRPASGRGRTLAALGAALGALAAPMSAPSAANIDSPILSGLPWRSGASADPDFGTWRGRRLDVRVVFIEHDSFDMMRKKLKGNQLRTNAAQTPQAVVSLAMLPRDRPGQHEACAGGEFDDEYREFGMLLVEAGAGAAVVRLGWEANGGPGNHPWGISDAAEVDDYIGCFRREALALKSAAPNLKIEWTNAKKGQLPISVLETYPGDDVVDIWGAHFYDTGPRKATQAVWDDYVVRENRRGGPWGLATWLREAKARGKKLAVSEWGMWNNGDPAPPDDPVYIENMYCFFRANAADIAYENYYNRAMAHQIYPSDQYPLGRAKYQELWSRGGDSGSDEGPACDAD